MNAPHVDEAIHPVTEISSPARPGLFHDVGKTLRLAMPLMAAQLAVIGLGLVDTVAFGIIGTDVLAAGGLAVAVFVLANIFCVGIVRAVGNQVAWAHGENDDTAIRNAVRGGILVAVCLGGLMVVTLAASGPVLAFLGQPPDLIGPATIYLTWAGLGILPNLIYTTLHGLTVGLSRPGATTVITFLAVVVKATVNSFIVAAGLGGADAMMALGLSTTMTFAFMALLIWLYCRRAMRSYLALPRMETVRHPCTRETITLGLPIGFTYAVEAGLFSAVALIVGRFGAEAIAAHQVANQCAHFTYMLAVGLSHAASVRIGHSAGRRDQTEARRLGLQSFVLGLAVMTATATIFIILGEDIARLIVGNGKAVNREVVELAAGLLMVAAAFQWFDGLQIIAIGALRGLKDTTSILRAAIVGYWIVGVSAAWILAQVITPAAVGAWIGIGLGLVTAAALMISRFMRLTGNTGRG